MDLRRFPAGTNLETGLASVEARLADVTDKQLREIGTYVQSIEPALIEDMKQDGLRTNAKAVALYLFECDPDMFSDLLLDA